MSNPRIVTLQNLEADIVAHIQFLQGQLETVKQRLREHIQAHESLQPQQKLLTSIVGVGESTAARVLSEIGSIEHFTSARQLPAFAGLMPQEYTSGTSVQGKTRLGKISNRRLRKALYFPALTWWRRCPQARAVGERLLATDKAKMQVIGALMHKLIRVIYSILKSGQPFDLGKLMPCSA